MESLLTLFVEVPICAFRPYASREYQDTYPFPTPSSVYGMLLSLIGVPSEEKARHRGVVMAMGIESAPGRAKVFRKLRRGKDLDSLRPDYQDLLIDVRLWIWLKPGKDSASPNLLEMVACALTNPALINRFGGLSLGESSYLINSISMSKAPPSELIFLRPDQGGFHHLPVWVDHLDASRTRCARFSLERLDVSSAIGQCSIFIE